MPTHINIKNTSQNQNRFPLTIPNLKILASLQIGTYFGKLLSFSWKTIACACSFSCLAFTITVAAGWSTLSLLPIFFFTFIFCFWAKLHLSGFHDSSSHFWWIPLHLKLTLSTACYQSVFFISITRESPLSLQSTINHAIWPMEKKEILPRHLKLLHQNTQPLKWK